MRNRIKRFLLCLLAVSVMTAGGSIYADDTQNNAGTDVSGETEEDSAVTVRRKEAEESPEFDADTAKKLFIPAGSSEGIDIYVRGADYEDGIWAAHGGKPDKDAELTEAQQQEKETAEAEIDAAKKMGEAVAIDSVTGRPAAEFRKLDSSDGETLFISKQGRYLVTVDEESGKLLKVRTLISALDSENAFLTDGGMTLDLMEKDNKSLDTSFACSGTEDGMRVYRNAETGEFAWLTGDMSHYLGAYRYCAENADLRMLADYRNAVIGIENKETGYIWWSSPPDSGQDTFANELWVSDLRSSNTMTYGIPENRSNSSVLRSGNPGDCQIKVSDIGNGIRVEYDYGKAGFKFPVEYTLEEDYLRAVLRVGDIEETNSANIATEMTVMGSFGAASDKEDGYFVIPDGSGALVRFNNDKTMGASPYAQRVYGNDVTAVPTSRGAVTEQIYLPVYGIVKEDNAMLVVAAKGDSNAVLSVKTSKQSNTSYNICNFSFTLRGTDTYYMSGSNSESFTVFERGGIKSDDIELRYYPISKEDADYVDVAARYREYLVEEAGVAKKTEADNAPLYVDLYGGVQKKRSVLGIPITMKTAVTTYDQAKDILTLLRDSGVDDMVVSYANWTNDGINNKVDTDAKPSGVLGGKSDFSSLRDFIDENGFSLYPVSDNRDFYSGNGYYSFTNTAVRISGAYARIVSYDKAYGIPDGFRKNMSLLSPDYFGKVFSDVSGSYSKAGLDGVSVANLTTSLYGDYGKNSISRYTAMNELINGYKKLDGGLSGGILADSANAYALPYVTHITNVPLTSSRFDVFDEDIPFYQIVMHGLIPYSTEAVNASADPRKLLLMAAVTGSSLSYDMLYEETSLLKDTEFDVYYYANYNGWVDTAAAEYRLLKPILASVSDCTITGYVTENNGSLVTAVYSDGTVIRADFNENTINYNGTVFDLDDYAEEWGIRF